MYTSAAPRSPPQRPKRYIFVHFRFTKLERANSGCGAIAVSASLLLRRAGRIARPRTPIGL